ncbi:MAG: polysaccharide biosynthesis tyrosine autokinase [Muribaculaceae bacterium]|nr:polysaccharide biosynthesis tyrosine autokinase [Muribaculaceae bacterium]
MSEHNSQENSWKRTQDADNGTLPILDVVFLTLRKWPWILLSLVVCVGLAFIYVLRTPSLYTRAAELMIKDSSKGQTAGTVDFTDLGLVNSHTNVDNEITNLRSGDLMADVIKRLGLDVEYYSPGRFHDEVAYGTSLPVRLEIVNFPTDASASMEIDVDKAGKVSISDIKSGSRKFDGSFSGVLKDSISTPIGTIVISPTAAYVKGHTVSLKADKLPEATALAIYSSRLTVSQTKDNKNVIRLTMSDYSIQRADDVLSTLIGVYKDSWIRDMNEIAVSTSEFINERLGVIERELGNVDNDISSYKSEHLIPDVGAASSMYMSQSQQISGNIMEINNKLQMAKFVRSYLTNESSRNQLLPANSGLVGDIARQVAEYNDMLLQRNNLVEKSSDTNPLVISLDQQLAALRNAMIATVDNQIAALNTELRSLQSSQAVTTSKLASSPTQAKYLLTVERQQKVKESLYLFLLQKREENELTQAFTAYNTRVVNNPGPAGVPPTPARSKILLIAALIGLLLPFGIIYLIEASNTKVRGRKDIEHLSLPFLGEIPQDINISRQKARKDDGEVNSLVVKEGKRDIINEAFRVLRTNVDFMRHSGNGANIIGLTSFNPGSGKSFITVNLGMTMALKGKKVLVIDGDMRHGSTSAYVGSPDHGLANYLADPSVELPALIVNDSENPNLNILPVGPVPPNPTELLESPRLAELIETVRPLYDYVFIDCPPVEVVADAQIIDAHVDRTIFVIRAGVLERAMLSELERMYQDKKYRSMALILNGTPLSRSRYGYSHGYRYGYGYGYGYGYNYEGHKGKKHKKKD